MKSNIKIAIIRPVVIPISRDFYNSQEIGLARGLSKCDINTDIYVAGSNSYVKKNDIESQGTGKIRLIEVPFFKLPLIDHAIYPKLIKLLKKEKYDFIQVNEENELTSFSVARYAYQHKIPVVVYQGMYEQLTGRIRSTFQCLYDKFLLPHFKKYIKLALVKTTRAAKHLEKKGFTKIRLMPVGLDPTPFINPQNRDWRNELDIAENSFIILYVGIFERRRNVDSMIDLAKQLEGKNIYLLMAGKGPEHTRITTRLFDENIKNVRLLGVVGQQALPSLYKEASLFLLPSNYEIYGMVLLESMYFGLPVISTNTAGPGDLIENDIDGILTNSLEPTFWLKKIIQLSVQPEIITIMSENAKLKIKNYFLWDAIASEYKKNIINFI